MRLIILLAFLASTPATAQIYKCSEESGNVTYSMTPCRNIEATVTVMGSSSDATKYYKCADKARKLIYRISSCLNNETVVAVRTISKRERKNSTDEVKFWQGHCSVTEEYRGTSIYTAWCENQFHYRDKESGGWKKIRASYSAMNRVVDESSVCELYEQGSYEKKICNEVAFDAFVENCDRATLNEEKKMFCDIVSQLK